MNNIKHEILNFFGSINEFDKRLYLRDCVDIFTNNRNELFEYYPYQVFTFLKLARIYKAKLDNDSFAKFIEKATENEEQSINYFIYHTTCKGIRLALSFNEKINKLKATNEIEDNKIFEASM
ncbi:hypothetical protein ACI2U6_16390 [Ralstonia nicotianae]